MLARQNHIKYIRHHLQQQNLLGTYPLYISEDRKLILFDSFKLKYEFVKNVIYLLYMIVLFAQLLNGWGKDSLIVELEAVIFFSAGSVYCYTKWIVLQKRESIIELLNLLLKFEQHHLNSK